MVSCDIVIPSQMAHVREKGCAKLSPQGVSWRQSQIFSWRENTNVNTWLLFRMELAQFLHSDVILVCLIEFDLLSFPSDTPCLRDLGLIAERLM